MATAIHAKKEAKSPELTDQTTPWAILGVLLLGLVVGYFNTFQETKNWWDSPKYSHGYLVPVFTLALLWMRRQPIGQVSAKERWCGLLVLAGALGLRLLATYFPTPTVEMYSFVPAVAGLFLLVGGWKTLRWAGPAIGFLIFMFPLPSFLDVQLLARLQKLATLVSTYLLQTLGIPTYSEGNTIFVGEVQMGVVEQCSGLRMLTIFMAIGVALILVTQQPIWERIIIVISTVPIALAANIFRVTLMGVLNLWLGPEIADRVFHAAAGWIMMPMALGMLYVEMQFLPRLIIEEKKTGPLSIGRSASSAPRVAP